MAHMRLKRPLPPGKTPWILSACIFLMTVSMLAGTALGDAPVVNPSDVWTSPPNTVTQGSPITFYTNWVHTTGTVYYHVCDSTSVTPGIGGSCVSPGISFCNQVPAPMSPASCTASTSTLTPKTYMYYAYVCDSTFCSPTIYSKQFIVTSGGGDATPPFFNTGYPIHSPSNPTTASSVAISVYATDMESTITQIQIYVDGTLRQTCTSPPGGYCSATSTYSSGPHTYYATATSSGGTATSSIGSFTVTAAAPTCSDGIMNQDETGIDCGGTCADPPVSKKCGLDIGCQDDNDCQSGYCDPILYTCQNPPAGDHCINGAKDDDETGIDCGGSCPNDCPNGEGCLVNGDCQSNYCNPGTYVCEIPPSAECSNGELNLGETDIDCGGPCPKCANGKGCSSIDDCTGICADSSPKKCFPVTPHTPPSSVYPGTATITVNTWFSGSYSKLYYRIGSSGSYTEVGMTHAGGGVWTGTTTALISGDTVNYYFLVNDDAGDVQIPASGTYSFTVTAAAVGAAPGFTLTLAAAVTLVAFFASFSAYRMLRRSPSRKGDGGGQVAPSKDKVPKRKKKH